MSVRGTKEALSSTIQQRRSDPRTSRVCTLYPNKALVNGGKRLFFLSLLIDFFEGSCDPISSGAEAVIYMPCKLNQSFSTDRSEGSVAPGSLLLGKRAPSRCRGGGGVDPNPKPKNYPPFIPFLLVPIRNKHVSYN